jgi:hypothetical protein
LQYSLQHGLYVEDININAPTDSILLIPAHRARHSVISIKCYTEIIKLDDKLHWGYIPAARPADEILLSKVGHDLKMAGALFFHYSSTISSFDVVLDIGSSLIDSMLNQ